MKTNEVNCPYNNDFNPFDRRQQSVMVVDVVTEDEFIYQNISPIRALINQHLIQNDRTVDIHNPTVVANCRNGIKSGTMTFSLGDLCVLKWGKE